MNQHAKDFIKVMDSIKPSRNRYEVFSDWLIMAAASLYAPWKKCQKTEDEYMEIANQYTKSELENHAQMLAIVVDALEKEEQDFLGTVFTMAELTNSKTGQFFTPYHVSRLISVCRASEP
jgi:type I restriction-modification system DNA methylase subunit